MNIHEYQGKAVLKNFGVTVSAGAPAFTVDEAIAAAKSLPGPVYVVKSQIHAGGRGKGKFVGLPLMQKAACGWRSRSMKWRPSQRKCSARLLSPCRPPGGQAGQPSLHRGRLRHCERILSLDAGRSRDLAHRVRRLHRRRHGYRESRARLAGKNRDLLRRSSDRRDGASWPPRGPKRSV